jgi:(p)ppGpp synthase/HD superfamily hydrolase
MQVKNIASEAFIFANEAHSGMVRKSNSNIPYIMHPIEVATILSESSTDFSLEVLAAAFLHDVVEDTYFTLVDITNAFGEKVANLVGANTEDKTKSWEERKQHTIDVIRTQTLEEKSLIVADKLSNIRSLSKTWNKKGELVWEDFKQGREKQAWYFRGVVEGAFTNLSPNNVPDFFFEFENLVTSFFG